MWEILLPCKMNDGSTIPVEHHKKWDEFVVGIAGGLTINGRVRGQWVSSFGRKYEEPIIPVRIVCSDNQINGIIDFTLKHYEQEAVLAYKISDTVILKNRK